MKDRREQLLEAAAQLFVQHGVRKTSVADVTRAAGVSKGSFYLEFSSKDALFDEVVRHEFSAYLADAAARVAQDPAGGRLSRIYHHSVHALLHRAFLRSLYTDTSGALTGLLHGRGPGHYRPRVLLGAEFIEQMQAAGLIRADRRPAAISHTLSTLMVGPLLSEPLLRSEGSPPLADTLQAISSMITDSYECASGDVEAGKRAFAALIKAMTDAMGEDLPSVVAPRPAPGELTGGGHR